MKLKGKAVARKPREKGFENPEVEAVFKAYRRDLRTKLSFLRQLIFDTASAIEGVGELEETLKWGQPSYLTTQSGSGSTIRIDRVKSDRKQYAMYFHCQTNLIAAFRDLYPNELEYGGNRSILFDANGKVPEHAIRHCVSLALTYHLKNHKIAPRNQ